FDLEGTISNKDAVGAIAESTGPFGTQIREVRAGESYGITNTFKCHFGIGNATSVSQVTIYWPSGLETVITNPAINTFHNVVESPCFLEAPAVVAIGSTQFCEGGSVTLQAANSGLTYEWSNGQTGQSITVSEAGNYFATASSAEGCIAITQGIAVTIVPNSPAVILPQGDTHICDNSSVVLTANQGVSYLWSNGLTSQSIEATEAGSYTVQVIGQCGESTSEPITVEVSVAPSAPSLTNVSILPGETATFTVTGGTNVQWYNSATSNTAIATGNSFTTPALSTTTSYWVEDINLTPGDVAIGGKSEQTLNNDGQYQTNSTYFLLFDANEDVIINSVKVFADGAANRTISVVDAAGATVATGTFNIPDGESIVNLEFFVPAGTGYGLRLVGNNPLLWRDKNLATPFDYPYEIGSLVTITNTNVSGADTDNYYYYFYDWNVQAPDFSCPSDRVEVQAIVAGINELTGVTNMELYPNPASSDLTISYSSIVSSSMNIQLIDQTGRVVFSQSFFGGTGANVHQLNVAELAAGIYQLQVVRDNQVASRKVVIE
ncbi:MAG: T9SS type A sorting domain-containing protein, partial [Flavobacteriales bacterium]